MNARPRGILAAASVIATLAAACSPTSPPNRHTQRLPARVLKASPATGSASRSTVRYPTQAAPGVPVQRLAPPQPTVTPHCPPKTSIGTQVVRSVTAHTRPDPNAPAIATFPENNSQGARQVYDLVDESTDSRGVAWYRALLPIRPNDTLGYIRADAVHLTWTDYWLLVDPRRFTVTLYRSCRQIARYPVGIGTGSTPTPVGYFFLQSLLQPPDPNGVYGVYAYGLSGYSDVIHTWRWGGLVGLHGTNDPSGIGHDVSHGCIRMYNQDIRRLVRLLPLGTPITIV